MALALVFLVAAKAANVSVPIVLKQIVDSLTGDGAAGAAAKAAAEAAAQAAAGRRGRRRRWPCRSR